MKNLVRATIAAAAFAALFVVPSIALAIQVTAPTGTPYIGSIIATNVAHANTPKKLTMTTSVGTLECEAATLTGNIHVNGPTQVTGNITTAQFENAGGAACSGPLGSVVVTPSHTSNPEHNGVKSLPWCLTAGAEDTFTVRGGLCTEAPRPLTFQLHTSIAGTCSYQKASVTGTYTTHPADAIATITGQEFTLVTGGGFCPPWGKLDMAFTLWRETNGVEVEPVYIDP